VNDWRASRSKRLQANLISVLGYRIISLLGSTLRWKTEGLEHFDAIVRSGHQPVMAFWHGRILPATYYFRRRGIVVITSENFDGEWIAGIIERFGFGTARGSTSRGARKALLQLKRDMAAGKPAGFTLDGPRGPARTAQPGAVWLAKATGNPVLPFHLEADRLLDDQQLGPDADSQAVRDGGDFDGRAVRGAGRCRRGGARGGAGVARAAPGRARESGHRVTAFLI
jgi:lysophospholipid acyltransferase (LPLAT)-like uncharacterized protein